MSAKDSYTIHVTVSIQGIDGYTTRTIHSADLTTKGPLDIPASIEECKALCGKAVNAIREASERAAIEAPKANQPEVPADKDAIAF